MAGVGTYGACRSGMRGLGTGVVIAALVSSGCLVLDIGASHCDNGRICPEGTRCVGAEGVCIPATCGNGVAAADEKCDGLDLRGQTCTSLGFHDEGELRCRDDCTFDTSACGARCGDGQLNGNEQCDGSDLAGKTCRDFGYHDEAGLACQSCAFDLEQCQGGRCGDGMLNGDERCDGSLVADRCIDLGFEAGSPRCTDLCGVSVASCGHIGWQHQLQQSISDLWCDGTTTVAVSNDDVLLHDGSLWTSIGRDVIRSPAAAWASSASNVWVGTAYGGLARWDGQAWRDRVSDGTFGAITALWGAGADDIYLTHARGLAHFDGTSWSSVDLPVGRVALNDVWGTSTRDIYVVGDDRTLLHFDGARWSTIERTVEGSPLRTVWASGPQDAYVVTGDGGLEHFDGEEMSPMNLPERCVHGISGSAPNDVYLVSRARACAADPCGVSLCHPDTCRALCGEQVCRDYVCGDEVHRYDGHRWSRLRSFGTETISAVWADGPTCVWTAGLSGVDEFRGADVIDLGPGYPGTVFDALWAASPREYFAAYRLGEGLPFVSSISHMVDDIRVSTYPAEGIVYDLRGFAADDVYAASSSGLLHFDGRDWITVRPEPLAAVWGNGGDDVYACGDGIMIRYDGRQWSSWPGPSRCTAGWSSGPDEVYVIGDGTAHQWDGARWIRFELGPDPVTVVWGWGPGEVYVGAGRKVLRRDDSQWVETGTVPGGLDDVIAFDRDDIFVVSRTGNAAHFDGYRWAPMSMIARRVHAISGTPDRILLGGDGGVTALIRTARWGCRERESDCDDRIDDDCDGAIDATDLDCESVR